MKRRVGGDLVTSVHDVMSPLLVATLALLAALLGAGVAHADPISAPVQILPAPNDADATVDDVALAGDPKVHMVAAGSAQVACVSGPITIASSWSSGHSMWNAARFTYVP